MHQGLNVALSKEAILKVEERLHRQVFNKTHNTTPLIIGNEVLLEVMDEGTTIDIWRMLKSLFKNSLTNYLYLKKKLYDCEWMIPNH